MLNFFKSDKDKEDQDLPGSMFESEMGLNTQTEEAFNVAPKAQLKQPTSVEDTGLKPPVKSKAKLLEEYAAEDAALPGSMFELEMGIGAEERTKKEKPIKWEEVYTDPYYLNLVKEYATRRFGDEGKQEKGESDEDYVKRWARQMRAVRSSPFWNTRAELNYLKNASDKDLEIAVEAHRLFDLAEEQPGAMPFFESAYYTVKDPSTYLTGIGGRVGLGVASKELTKQAITKPIQEKLKKAATYSAMGTGLAVGTYSAVQEKKIEQIAETGERETDVDILPKLPTYSEERGVGGYALDAVYNLLDSPLASGLIEATFGKFEAGYIYKDIRKADVMSRKQLQKDLLDTKKQFPKDKATIKFVTDFNEKIDETIAEYDDFTSKGILARDGVESPITDPQVKTDLNTRAVKVAGYIMEVDPSFRPKANQKISEAVRNVFLSIDESGIDDSVINVALKKAGVSSEEFALAIKSSTSDAGKTLQPYSALAKFLDRLSNIDSKAAKVIDEIYGKEEEMVSVPGALLRTVQKGERETKSIVVGAISTGSANFLGTGTYVTLESAAMALDRVTYTFGKALQTAVKGEYEKGQISRDLERSLKDSIGIFTYLLDKGLARKTVDKLLESDPQIGPIIFKSLQETGIEEVSKAARFVNALNVAQDGYFRRAVFAASVERQLRDVGLNMRELMATDTPIPSSILKNASDDALRLTFSLAPKQQKTGIVTAEAFGETMAHGIVDFVEKLPGGSVIFTPFPRFASNVIGFLYRHSLGGAAAIIQEIPMVMTGKKVVLREAEEVKKLVDFKDLGEKGKGRLITKDLSEVEIEKYARQARKKLSANAVGLIAIYAAYRYRLENQDTKSYEMKTETGEKVDMRRFFPWGLFLALGDIEAKRKLGKVEDIDVSESYEVLLGMKLPSGARESFWESLPEVLAGEEGTKSEKVGAALGKTLGDVVGRLLRPGEPIYAFLDAITDEAEKARDPNIVSSDNLFDVLGVPVNVESAANILKQRAPIVPEIGAELGVMERLPEAKSRTREETPRRVGEFFTALTGLRLLPPDTPLEREMLKFNIDPYKLYGTTGDKKYDRLIIEKSAPRINKAADRVINSKEYKEMTDIQKANVLNATLKAEIGIGRTEAIASLSSDEKTRITVLNKNKFNKLPEKERRLIVEMYKKENELPLGEPITKEDYDEIYLNFESYSGRATQYTTRR
jgi:hypothetical protein